MKRSLIVRASLGVFYFRYLLGPKSGLYMCDEHQQELIT